MHYRAREAHQAAPFLACVKMFSFTALLEVQKNTECSIHHFDEVSFFAKNEPFCLRHHEVLAPFRIRLKPCSICLVRSQAVECDQPPCNIIRSFVGKEIPDQMSTAPRNDVTPILGVPFECVSLEWIDLIAYDTHYRHWYPLSGRSGRCIAPNAQGCNSRHHAGDGFATVYLYGGGLC
jgi:hypothetical protein